LEANSKKLIGTSDNTVCRHIIHG